MTTIITTDPTLYNLWRWHPVVLPGENEKIIAAPLIENSINQMKDAGADRLEVCFDFPIESLSSIIFAKSRVLLV